MATMRDEAIARRAVPWIGMIGDLIGQPLTAMPHEPILGQLRETFDITAAALNVSRPGGGIRTIIRPSNAFDNVGDELGAWQRGELDTLHPLMIWHLTVGDPRPSTCARVPREVVSERARHRITSIARSVGAEQQLSINVRLGGNQFQTYVLGRSGTDFTDDDLLVADQIRRALVGLDRMIELNRRIGAPGPEQAIDAELTPRELGVLTLLADGLSSRQMARRLACSPRTVEKHLERAYRKLGVRDRVNALRIAQHWGLESRAGLSGG